MESKIKGRANVYISDGDYLNITLLSQRGCTRTGTSMNGNIPQALGDRIFGCFRKVCEQGSYAPVAYRHMTHPEKLQALADLATDSSSFEDFASKLEDKAA